MKIPLSLFLHHTIDQYDLQSKVRNGHVYHKIRCAIYGLTQSRALANVQLPTFLAPEGHYELAHTSGLWRHITRPIQYKLVADYFRVKYVGQEHAEHLINTIKKHYEFSGD